LRSLFKQADPLSVTDICTKLSATEGACQLLNEVVRFIKLVLVVPSTSAERMQLLHLTQTENVGLSAVNGRSTKTRLNHVMLLNIHKKRLDDTDMHEVAQDFIRANEKRSHYFGVF
jgi:hypothetical protein